MSGKKNKKHKKQQQLQEKEEVTVVTDLQKFSKVMVNILIYLGLPEQNLLHYY